MLAVIVVAPLFHQKRECSKRNGDLRCPIGAPTRCESVSISWLRLVFMDTQNAYGRA